MHKLVDQRHSVHSERKLVQQRSVHNELVCHQRSLFKFNAQSVLQAYLHAILGAWGIAKYILVTSDVRAAYPDRVWGLDG